MTPEEKAVIDAAIKGHRGCAPESCGGSSYDPCRLGHALEMLTLIRSRASEELQCQCSRTAKVYCAAKDCHGGADVPQWVPATFLYALSGDRIRIGMESTGYEETDVLRSSSGAWHAHVVSSVMPSGKTWDKITPWEHTEVRLELAANPGFIQYPQDGAIEILMDAERRAVHTLMTVFPGTKRLEVREG